MEKHPKRGHHSVLSPFTPICFVNLLFIKKYGSFCDPPFEHKSSNFWWHDCIWPLSFGCSKPKIQTTTIYKKMPLFAIWNTPSTQPHGYNCSSYNDLLRFIKKIGYFSILVLHKFMTKFQYHKISIELMWKS